MNNYAHIGKALAFSSLVAAATILEICGLESGGLWIIIVIWIIASY